MLASAITQVSRCVGPMPRCSALATLQSPANMLRRDLETENVSLLRSARRQHHPVDWSAGAGHPRRAPSAGRCAVRFCGAQATVVARLRPIAERLGRPLAQLALAWLLARPGVAMVIPGASQHASAAEECRCSRLEPCSVGKFRRSTSSSPDRAECRLRPPSGGAHCAGATGRG